MRPDGVELRSLFGKAFEDLAPAEIDEIARRCRDAGIAVNGCATPVFKCDLDDQVAINERVDLFKRSLESARVLGSELVRVFTFIRRSHPATSDEIARAAAVFPTTTGSSARQRHSHRRGKRSELHRGERFQMREFLSHLPNDPRLGVVWDLCNVLYLDGSNDPVAPTTRSSPTASAMCTSRTRDAKETGLRRRAWNSAPAGSTFLQRNSLL